MIAVLKMVILQTLIIKIKSLNLIKYEKKIFKYYLISKKI